jgi:hypothetical protein
MKKFNSGYELAKEMGIPAEKLERIFAEYRDVAAGKKKDKWGKKFFHKWVYSASSGRARADAKAVFEAPTSEWTTALQLP